ncbi:MAG: GTP cyclohydrolase FolE2 [Candidatus Cloacimonetes bacterium]|nr:GTP cyclohydrolase FolE2 [Candidatus Cloacimonadota bacterium]MDD4156986.1 GTP cyclohydrolase FolE2 [Candidatus Cloacimonadota bacterium]
MINKDVQSENDKRNITIDKVGVKNIKYPIIVEDKENKLQHTIADIDIFVELPHHHRGTHMSRFLEVLHKYRDETLIDNLEAFLQDINKALNSNSSFVKLSFPYFLKKTAPVSQYSSLMDYECLFEASLNKEFNLMIGVKVPVTSLCPCSKEISRYGAHNQRSYVTIKVSYNKFVWLEELIKYAEESASCEIYSLLKRPDEKYVTEKAYDHPVFVEDIVRDITLKLNNDDRIDWFSVESENMESIHNHSAYALIERDKRKNKNINE